MADSAESQRRAALVSRLEEDFRQTTRSADHSRRTDRRFMNARLLAFLLIVVAFVLAIETRDVMVANLWFPLSIVGFLIVLRMHGPIRRRLRRFEIEIKLISEKLARIRGDVPWMTRKLPAADLVEIVRGDQNPAWVPLDSSSLEDLAVIGSARSLESLIDTTETQLGRAIVHHRLRHTSLDSRHIRELQAATFDLLGATEPRKKLEVLLAELRGLQWNNGLTLLTLSTTTGPPDGPTRGLMLLAALVPGLWLSAAFLSSNLLALVAVAGTAIVQFLHREISRRVVVARVQALELEPMLRCIPQLLEEVEKIQTTSTVLLAIKSAWIENSKGRHASFARLLKLLRFLKIYRLGLIYVVFNYLTFWDSWFGLPFLRLLRRHSLHLRSALLRLGELEFHLALARTAEEQDGLTRPQLLDQAGPVLCLKAGRHPLLLNPSIQANDLELDQSQRIRVITGTNMSGKSTYLKMAGLNLALAQMGGPVRAASFSWTPLFFASVINVRDELADGESFFAVEVRRVGEILRRAALTPHVICFLDELFRGTNTREKIAAGKALILHLAHCGVFVLAATHDHEMTSLEAEIPGVISNWHFSDQVKDGVMVFDHQIRPGPVLATNALAVLESRGFPASLIADARRRIVV